MTKKVINQKGKLDEIFINSIENKYNFNNKPINRFNLLVDNKDENSGDKIKLLEELKKKNKFN